MNKPFYKKPLWEVTRVLADVAQGRRPADTVIENVTLVNVNTAEIIPNTCIAISNGRIAYVGADASFSIGDDTAVYDGDGMYAAPGFLDGHMHVESSMMGVSEYARAVVPHGTTGIYMDPHEICNVLGLRGVKLMAQDAKRVPLKAMITTPSCVPAVPGFEDTGSAALGPGEIAETMTWDSVVGLGEMMNFPGILASDANAHGEVDETLKAGLTVTGHYSSDDIDRGLNAYAASGISNCHESTHADQLIAKMRLGMYGMLREGSAWQDLHDLAPVIVQKKVDSRFAMLVSDDNHPHTLVRHGHVDYLIRRAIEEGIDPVTAIQMVTVNTATAFQMQQDLGQIAPGKCADIVLFEDLHRIDVRRVFIDGDLVAQEGTPLFDPDPFQYPEWATHSMHVGTTIAPETFRVAPSKLSPDAKRATIRVIETIPVRANNIERHISVPVVDGCIESDVSQDVLKTFVFERHHDTGRFGVGFTKGLGIADGAVASTVAHDAHNLAVIGTNDSDMAIAAQALIDCEGGQAIVQHGKVIAMLPLPIAGLMDARPAEEMSQRVECMEAAWRQIGCTMDSPFMTMASLSLACIPDLRVTDRGLVDCKRFEFVDLLVDQER